MNVDLSWKKKRREQTVMNRFAPRSLLVLNTTIFLRQENATPKENRHSLQEYRNVNYGH